MQNPDLTINIPGATFMCRAAALIIRDGKLLAVNNKVYPNLYYTVGGRVNLHETTQEAVVREVYEEIGVVLEVDKPVFINERFLRVDGITAHELVFYYTMKSKPDLDIANGVFTDQGELETLHWLPLADLDNYNLVPPWLKTGLGRLDDINSVEHIISKEY